MKSLQRLWGLPLSLGLTLAIPSWPALPVVAQLAQNEQVAVSVYRAASPAVVTIQVARGSGSGSIVRSDGLVLTNEHVIRVARGGQALVTLANGRRFPGRVIASDRANDLALIQIQAQERFPTIPLASEGGIAVGQQVFAIGSPFGLSGTFTTGILSRIAPNGDLQTDAAINPGNSGGPLLNSRGELIGVNKAILSPSGRGNVGIGFATNVAIARQFIAGGRNLGGGVAAVPGRAAPGPRLGVFLDRQSLVVQSVEPGSLAAAVGLRQGDRLVAVNGRRLRSADELVVFLDRRPAAAVLTIGRGNRLSSVQVRF